MSRSARVERQTKESKVLVELDLDGSVHAIGGVKQKTFGARKAGADVLLMPAGENAAEARKYAGSLRVIPVESFQQALQELATLSPK